MGTFLDQDLKTVILMSFSNPKVMRKTSHAEFKQRELFRDSGHLSPSSGNSHTSILGASMSEPDPGKRIITKNNK